MATQMQHEVFWLEITWLHRFFRDKYNNKVESDQILMSILTWKTKKELNRKKETIFVGGKTWKLAVRK